MDGRLKLFKTTESFLASQQTVNKKQIQGICQGVMKAFQKDSCLGYSAKKNRLRENMV